MTKIVFLDFDGVLLPDPLAQEQAEKGLGLDNYLEQVVFNPICVSNLNQLLKTTNAEIVLSTSWAYGASISEISNCLLRNGIDPSGVFEYDDPSEGNYMTPRSVKMHRGEEIQAWVQAHPEIESWVAIDDNPNILYLKTNYVRTNPRYGFDKKCLTQALEILRG